VLQIQLTADYAPSTLMDFLTASQYYPLEAALAICQRRGMVSEQVYILGRMGSAKQALHLIIEKLGDIPQVGATSGRQGRDKRLVSSCMRCCTSLLPYIAHVVSFIALLLRRRPPHCHTHIAPLPSGPLRRSSLSAANVTRSSGTT